MSFFRSLNGWSSSKHPTFTGHNLKAGRKRWQCKVIYFYTSLLSERKIISRSTQQSSSYALLAWMESYANSYVQSRKKMRLLSFPLGTVQKSTNEGLFEGRSWEPTNSTCHSPFPSQSCYSGTDS